MSSTDFNVKDASDKIAGLKKEEDIFSFVQGDERITVQNAATKRLSEIEESKKPKQGESGNVTKNNKDFKTETTQKGADVRPDKSEAYVSFAGKETSNIQIRDGRPAKVTFIDGKEVKVEPCS